MFDMLKKNKIIFILTLSIVFVVIISCTNNLMTDVIWRMVNANKAINKYLITHIDSQEFLKSYISYHQSTQRRHFDGDILAMAYKKLINQCIANKEYAQGLKYAEDLVDFSPYAKDSYLLRGYCYLKESKYQKAQEDYYQAWLIEPTDLVAWSDLLKILGKNNAYDQIIYTYEVSRFLSPSDFQISKDDLEIVNYAYAQKKDS